MHFTLHRAGFIVIVPPPAHGLRQDARRMEFPVPGKPSPDRSATASDNAPARSGAAILVECLIEQGVEFGHADTHGKYREIDTQEDMELAQRGWKA